MMISHGRVTLGIARRNAGFTIIELLISMAIIFIIVALVFVALRTASRAANRTTTMNALRQMMTGYSSYTNENGGRLLPGYIEPSMIGPGDNQLKIKAELANGRVLDAGDTASYVWRLAPYLDHAWRIYMTDYRSSELEAQFQDEYGSGEASDAFGPATYDQGSQLGIGISTSIGLNSIYCGGDSFHGPATDRSPWSSPNANNPNPNRIAATRFADCKNPSKLIVFGPTRREFASASPSVSTQLTSTPIGYVELRPPYVHIGDDDTLGLQWSSDSESRLIPGSAWTGGAGGVPHDRYESADRVSFAHMDGSVEPISYLDFIVDPNLNGSAQARALKQVMSYWMPDYTTLPDQ